MHVVCTLIPRANVKEIQSPLTKERHVSAKIELIFAINLEGWSVHEAGEFPHSSDPLHSHSAASAQSINKFSSNRNSDTSDFNAFALLRLFPGIESGYSWEMLEDRRSLGTVLITGAGRIRTRVFFRIYASAPSTSFEDRQGLEWGASAKGCTNARMLRGLYQNAWDRCAPINQRVFYERIPLGNVKVLSWGKDSQTSFVCFTMHSSVAFFFLVNLKAQ